VPDVNTDTTIDSQTITYDAATAATMSGVHIKPLESANRLGISFRVLPGSDSALPGATEAFKGNTRLAAVDVNGDIIILDKAIAVRLKAVDLQKNPDAPVTFEMTYNGEAIAEILITTSISSGGSAGKVEIVETATATARPRPNPTVKPQKDTQPFTDIPQSDPFAQIAQRLFERKIIAGYPSNVKGQLLYKPENLINRAEFTQIALKMLCIIPRDEAKKLPSPFYDVLDPKSWFYPTLKEGNIRGFIKGYLGEKKTDPATGQEQSPFKPANNITRAEAATVVIAALWEENIIDLSKYNFQWPQGGQWYDPYIEISKDLKPYLVNPADTARTYLLTPEEAAKPDQLISRKDFAIMADRVLLVYDCFNPDSDDDGLPDDWEADTGKQLDQVNPQEDPDKDGCNNLKEYQLGTDPFNADTDGDSAVDCEEVNKGTDPLNPYDGKQPTVSVKEIIKNQEGIYVLRPICGQACPCRATIGPGGDLQLGDIIFAAITGPNGLPIYAKSNEEKY